MNVLFDLKEICLDAWRVFRKTFFTIFSSIVIFGIIELLLYFLFIFVQNAKIDNDFYIFFYGLMIFITTLFRVCRDIKQTHYTLQNCIKIVALLLIGIILFGYFVPVFTGDLATWDGLTDWSLKLQGFGVFVFSLYGIIVIVSFLQDRNNFKSYFKQNMFTIVEYSLFNYIFITLLFIIFLAPIFLLIGIAPNAFFSYGIGKFIGYLFVFFLTGIIPSTFLFGLPLLIIIPATIASYNHMNKVIRSSK